MPKYWNFREILNVHPEWDMQCVAIKLTTDSRCEIIGWNSNYNYEKAKEVLDKMDRTADLGKCRKQLDDLAYLLVCGNPHRKMINIQRHRCKLWNLQISAFVTAEKLEAKERARITKQILTEVPQTIPQTSASGTFKLRKELNDLIISSDEATPMSQIVSGKSSYVRLQETETKQAYPRDGASDSSIKSQIYEPEDSKENSHMATLIHELPSPPDSLLRPHTRENQEYTQPPSPPGTPTKLLPTANSQREGPSLEASGLLSGHHFNQSSPVVNFGSRDKASSLKTFDFNLKPPNSDLRPPQTYSETSPARLINFTVGVDLDSLAKAPRDNVEIEVKSTTVGPLFMFGSSTSSPTTIFDEQLAVAETAVSITPVIAVESAEESNQKPLPIFDTKIFSQPKETEISTSEDFETITSDLISTQETKKQKPNPLTKVPATSADGSSMFSFGSQGKLAPKTFDFDRWSEVSHAARVPAMSSAVWNLLDSDKKKAKKGGEDARASDDEEEDSGSDNTSQLIDTPARLTAEKHGGPITPHLTPASEPGPCQEPVVSPAEIHQVAEDTNTPTKLDEGRLSGAREEVDTAKVNISTLKKGENPTDVQKGEAKPAEDVEYVPDDKQAASRESDFQCSRASLVSTTNSLLGKPESFGHALIDPSERRYETRFYKRQRQAIVNEQEIQETTLSFGDEDTFSEISIEPFTGLALDVEISLEEATSSPKPRRSRRKGREVVKRLYTSVAEKLRRRSRRLLEAQ